MKTVVTIVFMLCVGVGTVGSVEDTDVAVAFLQAKSGALVPCKLLAMKKWTGNPRARELCNELSTTHTHFLSALSSLIASHYAERQDVKSSLEDALKNSKLSIGALKCCLRIDELEEGALGVIQNIFRAQEQPQALYAAIILAQQMSNEAVEEYIISIAHDQASDFRRHAIQGVRYCTKQNGKAVTCLMHLLSLKERDEYVEDVLRSLEKIISPREGLYDALEMLLKDSDYKIRRLSVQVLAAGAVKNDASRATLLNILQYDAHA
ncbi:MAG: hypothetical protein HRU15_14370, partial [Planctomycetes bacterium]|nr:hypothetical protein [Planctomycetota bacterium]